MAKIQISTFQGIAPRIDARLLDESQGQIAENLRLTSLALQSWRESAVVATPIQSTLRESIYLYDGVPGGAWLTWDVPVNVVEAPLVNDSTNRLYWTGDGKPKAGDNADNNITGIAPSGGTGIYPENSVTLGVPSPTVKPTVTVNNVGTDPNDKIWVYTFVSFWGEESAPSPASDLTFVDMNDGDVTLSGLEIAYPAEYNTLSAIRVYRSNSGVNAAAYQFVAEIALATTYNDTTPDSDLNEVISSSDYDLPPTDMFGILDAGNGILVGFTETSVCFCEPYQPHAWPQAYRLGVVSTVVGGGLFGNTVVVCTDDQPVLVVGNHPSTMTMTIHPDHQACLSAQGIVSMRGAVVYPSPNGLYQIGYGGGKLLTETLYDRETWQERLPEQMRASHWDTRYIAFTDEKGIVIETANDIIAASDFNIDVDSLYNDSKNDDLYICQSNGTDITILAFNVGGQRIPYKWRSKIVSLGSQATITAGKVLAQYGSLYTQSEVDALAIEAAAIQAENETLTSTWGSLNGAEFNRFDVNGSLIQQIPVVPTAQNVVLTLYADGVEIGSAGINSDEPFRLPSGYRGRQFEIEIETYTDVNQITLSSSIEDLLD